MSDRSEYLRRQLAAERVARLLALAAGLGADAAVRHCVGVVPLALLTADAAGCCARLAGGGSEWSRERGLAGADAPGRVAQIGAVAIAAEAAGEPHGVRPTETGGGAGGAGLGAGEAGADAGDQRVGASVRRCVGASVRRC